MDSRDWDNAVVFEIVVICTGNRNRSVIAEASIRRAAQRLPVAVSSAGLLDLGEASALPETLTVGAALGLDVSAHRTRFIEKVDVASFDLVLGLELQHVATAVVDNGVSPSRAFTLLECADLLQQVGDVVGTEPVARARARVAAADELRSSGAGPVPASVADPFGGPMSGYHEMSRVVQQASHRVVGALFRDGRAPGRVTSRTRLLRKKAPR